MKRIVRSMGYALSGLGHAVSEERNIRQFLIGLAVYVLAGVYVGFWPVEWIVVLVMATGFFIVELLNTSIERLGDAIDDAEKTRRGGHYHVGIKQAKDVAAAASLVALLLVVVILGSMLTVHVIVMNGPLPTID